jgi:hypothetical protein
MSWQASTQHQRDNVLFRWRSLKLLQEFPKMRAVSTEPEWLPNFAFW